MIDLRPILLINGYLLTTLGMVMLIPLAFDAFALHRDWVVFAGSSILTLFVGGALILSNYGANAQLDTKQAFCLTTLSWSAITLFSCTPFMWSELEMSFTDAFFEAMSGLTTTGATVIIGLQDVPPGILIWRALLQWLGGIGIIVMAIAVLPMLQVGGMQLFRMESSDNSEKILPRVRSFATSIAVLYLALTVACFSGYWAAGMTPFDAIAHAMTTIATGGFSTYDLSMGFFRSPAIELVAIVFMVIASLPFLVLLQVRPGQIMRLFADVQVRWFLGLLAIFIALAWFAQMRGGQMAGFAELRAAAFNVTSIMTGTGYATTGFDTWSTFSATLFLFIMFIGGCAGSTSCGIKVFRFYVIFETLKTRVLRFTHPHRVVVSRFNGKPMTPGVGRAVMNFLFLYFFSFAVIASVLSGFGIDPVTALSASASALSNVGPGLGPIVGPLGTYESLPDGAKWILSFAMLLGRLELFAVLVLLTPAFWRN